MARQAGQFRVTMAARRERDQYFIRGEDDRVFGPVSLATLVEWAKDSRIEPTFSVSRDKSAWVAAPRMAELGMVWLVETAPGTFYGPFNRAVVDSLLEAGTLPRDSRLYELDSGRAASELTKLKAELAAKESALADLEERAAKQAETTRKTISFMEAKLAELAAAGESAAKAAAGELAVAHEEIYSCRERAEAAEARAAKAEAEKASAEKRLGVAETEIADLRAQLDSVTKFVPKEEPRPVLQPEIVTDGGDAAGSAKPAKKGAFRFPGGGSGGMGGLAALEAAARRELAAAKKQGIGIGGIFGGKK